jgi:meiosis arrest female protein 1
LLFLFQLVELFRNAPQFSIFFNKFVRSYHYHFGYQCRLSDYGFLKLADLVEAISGVVEMEAVNTSSDGDRKIYLSHKIALRVFAEQLKELIVYCTGNSQSMIKLNEILRHHKSKFGYQIQPQNFGFYSMVDVIRAAPYIEVSFKIF